MTAPAPAADLPLNRDAVWETILFMRDRSRWAGNRFEIDLGGIKFSIQRRGRQILTAGNRKVKLSDTYFSRGDHGWLIIVRNFNFQQMMVEARTPVLQRSMNALALLTAQTQFKLAEIEFQGDRALFENNYVMMKMFGDWE